MTWPLLLGLVFTPRSADVVAHITWVGDFFEHCQLRPFDEQSPRMSQACAGRREGGQ